MIFNFLRILFLFIFWWAALWFALPADWLQGVPLSLVTVHIAPPSLMVAAWLLFKRVRVWYTARVERLAAGKTAAERAGQQKTALDAHREELNRRRAHVECRGIFAALSKSPDWMKATKCCTFIKKDAREIWEIGLEAALAASLKIVFESAFVQSKATVWLPVRLAHEGIPADWVESVWKQAIESSRIENSPASLDCQCLPGVGSVADLVIDLFENEPTLPAVLVLSLDSPLADAPEPTDDAGHAVLALLLSRPGLAALEIGRTDFDGQETKDDPYAPYWERNFGRDTGALQWRRIPPSLRLDFLSRCMPVATLHKPACFTEQVRALKQQIHDAILESFIHAGLRDAPFKEEDSGLKETAPLEIGWLVHDSPDTPHFVALASALANCGYELEPIAASGKLQDEFGNVGVAREALMLAVSMIRAAQLKKPVLLAGFGEGGVALGVSKAVESKPEVKPVIKPAAQPRAKPRFLRLATGDRCPETGWWLCIQTDRKARVLKGQNMPWAMYEQPATGWLNRLRGIDRKFSHQGPGIWAWIGVSGDEDIDA